MANIRSQNAVFIDSTGAISGTARVTLIGVELVAGSTAATLKLRITDGSGSPKFATKVVTAEDSKYLDLSQTPILFEDVIHAAISGTGAEAYLIIRSSADR